MSPRSRVLGGIALLGVISWPIAHAIKNSVMSPEELAARGPFWHWFLFFFIWIASIPTFFMLAMMVRQGHAQDDSRERGMSVEDRIHPRQS